MKWKHLILFLAVVVAACSTRHSVETRFIASPNQQLQAIDSLMWYQPDSALMVLVDFAATPKADSLSAFEGHYCQMLLSELLYKNDCEQSNREKLLKAVRYFDSIVGTDETDARKADTRGVSLRERNAFLDARAHYINGVGFYERDNLVEACAEYLKALEVMEGHFGEEDLVKNKAKFMAYTYNRLGDMFSGQFMMENAISCYEKSLIYCKIEPISSQSVSNMFFLIGKQYDKMNEIDKARLCYEQALGRMKNSDNLLYRDVFFCKTVCDYQVGKGLDKTMDELRQIVVQADDEKERLNRFLTIGAIFMEEGIYDSALYYFDIVFQYEKDMVVKMRAAESMRSIYDKLGDKEKYDEWLHFLALQKKPDGEDKALVSQLDDSYQNHVKQKQEKQTEAEHAKHIRKIVGFIVPIAVLLALAIIIVAKLRSRKLLKQQQKEAEQAHEEELRRLQVETQQRLEETERKHRQKVEEMVKRHEDELRIQRDQSEKEMEQTKQRHEAELEAERLAYQKEREGLQLNLQLSKRNVNTLQVELGRKRTDAEGHYEAFLKEPVCVKINDAVRDLQITTRKPYTSYRVNFGDETFTQFGLVVSAYYGEVKPALLCLYPSIAQEDLLLCYLYLLGMENKQIAVVRQREYSTVRKQAGELKKRLGIEEHVRDYVLCVAGVEKFVKE